MCLSVSLRHKSYSPVTLLLALWGETSAKLPHFLWAKNETKLKLTKQTISGNQDQQQTGGCNTPCIGLLTKANFNSFTGQGFPFLHLICGQKSRPVRVYQITTSTCQLSSLLDDVKTPLTNGCNSSKKSTLLKMWPF